MLMEMYTHIILFFGKHPNAVRLNLYLDEFEVCNLSGFKRDKQKVLGVHYLIGNLDCKYWSEVKHIHLCILVRYQHFKEFDQDYAKYLSTFC